MRKGIPNEPPEHKGFTAALAQYRWKCRKTGVRFSLERDQVFSFFKAPCFYCASPPSPRTGIDRLDPRAGYVIGNVVPCCWLCNRMKSNTPALAFVQRCVAISKTAWSLA